MGEYFNWVNVDKKEYICPGDFDYGNKHYESCHRKGEVLLALKNLLANEWKGCRVVWLGDESSMPKNIAPEFFTLIQKHTEEMGYSGDIFDTVRESYKNKSGLFKSAEKNVREEKEFFLQEIQSGNKNECNEYGIDPENPFKGLFQREGQKFKYTINFTKKVYYSFEETKILYQSGEECDYADALPELLGYGRSLTPGPWLGDVIGVSNEITDDIKILKSIIHLF